jgi:hypothetical protein
MTNYEYTSSNDNIEQADEREALVDHYLNERDLSYDGLINQLENLGGRLAFHDTEQLPQIPAAFTAGTTVAFSERLIPGDYQIGTLTEDTFLVPLASIDHPQNLYRPQLCATIQDTQGTIDALLFPIAKRSDGTFEVRGIKIYSNGLPAS